MSFGADFVAFGGSLSSLVEPGRLPHDLSSLPSDIQIFDDFPDRNNLSKSSLARLVG